MAKHIACSLISLALAATTVNAHAFFHTGYVNGVSQGHLFGVRAPQSNNPIQDVSSSAIACNSPLNQPVSTDVIEVAPGDKFGTQWNHNIAGASPGDGDDPIAASHKGPMMAYMAKVDDAATSDGSGLKWFKVAEEGLDTSTGKWGVDTMIANKGLWSFTIPNLAAGDYLLRGEALALHSAGSKGEAQFYMSCAAVRVTGSGTCAPTDTVSFPGAYSATDPGILISIYGSSGQPDNGGKAYTAPGPAVAKCDGSSAPAKPSSASSASVSVSATVTTANNVASSSSKGVDASTSAATYTTTTFALPTTMATMTSSKPAAGKPTTTSGSADVPSATGTSPATPSSSGYPMTGPGGKKFMCYEVTDF
ncbi:hypothetical protein PMZ80_006133 [Knufia obscura]|uniref:AA9 family lytic polysaccharide monooxygenase n=2 Tax=Knufia TaxID=430999 RepID=A0AAN8I8M2_9EURO|nr:hypothetical protein PMZ80_006133 [Knufia obscura]KAK5954801.1 hypothetical protein OHC33_004527 [Knufia fluminis]